MTLLLPGAACFGMDAELFYPTKGTPPSDIARAKSVCASCPACDECLELGIHESFGIWGGTTYHERVRIRERRGDVRHR